MRFGEITLVDCEVMEKVLRLFGRQELLRFCEIGTHRGGTARAVKEWCAQHGPKLEYWGVDNGILGDFGAPFEGANFLKGYSQEVFMHVPFGMDVVFIDGNHGCNAVILDTFHYGKRVRTGGVLLFHDTAPHLQGTMREHEGPDEHPWFYNCVNDTLSFMGFPWPGWQLLYDEFDPNAKIGGMRAYLKLAV